MADTYGAIELPIQVPGADASVSDPLLDVTGAFFKAWVNRYGAAAWQAVQPNTLPVQHVNTNDPEEVDFNERDLPCLYLWRAGTGNRPPERMAEDVYVMRDQVMLFWVFPPARQAFRAFRSQFVAGLGKLLHMAIELGRDPAWKVPGDPDPQAATYGSVFPRHAGWIEMFLSKWQSKAMVVQMADSPPRSYPALYATLDVAEQFDFDLAKFDALAGLDQKIYDPTNTLLVVERDTVP